MSALLGILILVAPACDLSTINVDPTRPADVDLRLILPALITQTAYNQSSNPARISGIIMQQMIGFDAQQVAYTDYQLPQNTFNNYWRTGTYAGALKDCQVIIDKATAEGQPYYSGIAKVLMAENYGMLAAMFGDVPFSQALKGTENLTPAYDSQEAVYAGVQALLDDAINDLSQAEVAGGPAADDLIYSGDAAAWIGTANALKARYTMHLTKRNGATAANAALALIENSAFSSAADQPNFLWSTVQTAANPIALFGIQRPNTLVIDARFNAWMDGNSDPRLPFYMTTNGSEWQFYDAGAGLRWSSNDSPIPIISFTELSFLKAEALLWTGADDATVQAALEDAISASMAEVGVTDTAAIDAYIADRADMSGLSGTDEKLERIMEEAYVGLYGMAFQQVWTNYRRNGYPALTPSASGSGGLNPSGVIPRRFLYPDSESTTNRENWEAAQAAQGGALLDADTWAFE
ncbi:MAG: SusD/RagB family nutrient-binding outer membrane lipoprotein [Bacteroidota bacterium]